MDEYKDVKSDWLDARNLCRKHCMDSISIETVEENDMVLEVLQRGNSSQLSSNLRNRTY